MLSGPDNPGGITSSLGSRRPAASNLPSLNELPPPPLTQLHSKFQPYGSSLNAHSQPTASSGSVASVGNLLTPPNSLQHESVLPHASSAPSSTTLPSFQPQLQQQQSHGTNLWSSGGPQFGPYNTTAGSTTQQQQQWIPPRGMFSPSSLDSLVRQSSAMSGMLHQQQQQQQSYDQMNQLPPFPSSNAGLSGSITLPAMAAAQHLQNVNTGYLAQQGSSQAYNAQTSPINGQDSYATRLPPTPSYFNQMQVSPTSNQQPLSFHPSVGASQLSPLSPISSSEHHNGSRIGSSLDRTISLQSNPSLHSTSQSPPIFQRSSFGQYSQSPMGLSSLHSPSNSMGLVNNMSSGMTGYNGGHVAGMQNMYGAHQTVRQPPQQQQQHQPQPQHQTPTDRPFKCDSCPQSFNRNHDLKRHKRIHLAVKPYPCSHCDKSFSRKDALKRHILVKGCGKVDDQSSPDGDDSISPRTLPVTMSSL